MKDLHYFELLKAAILKKYQAHYPEWQEPLQAFRRREIEQFQQLVQEQVGSRISERWIYTHLKADKAEKLPRIDMLDLLSQWVGAESWQRFKADQALPAPTTSPVRPARKTLYLITLALIGISFSLAFWWSPSYRYTICLEQKQGPLPVDWSQATCTLLWADESPQRRPFDAEGCLEIKTTDRELTFVLEAPYHRADTIIRQLRKRKSSERFQLQTDDYALAIHYFSEGAVSDWKKRRQQLDRMIAPEAEIIQLTPDGQLGMELYDKTDFINKLTLPLSSLKNLRIIFTEYNPAGQIQKLRFTQEAN
ncbi:MAG: hypothetical protein KDC44_16835 [Phaeodactylibacter sp.]|nr:hypothetical protein [Phaeodactylibacter sp.]